MVVTSCNKNFRVFYKTKIQNALICFPVIISRWLGIRNLIYSLTVSICYLPWLHLLRLTGTFFLLIIKRPHQTIFISWWLWKLVKYVAFNRIWLLCFKIIFKILSKILKFILFLALLLPLNYFQSSQSFALP